MNETQRQKLGQLLGDARAKKGMSLEMVGNAVGWDRSAVMRLERGEVAEPNPDKLAAMLDVLGLTASRVNRVTGGYLEEALTPPRDYFRARYDLSPEQTELIEAEIAKLKAKPKRR